MSVVFSKYSNHPTHAEISRVVHDRSTTSHRFFCRKPNTFFYCRISKLKNVKKLRVFFGISSPVFSSFQIFGFGRCTQEQCGICKRSIRRERAVLAYLQCLASLGFFLFSSSYFFQLQEEQLILHGGGHVHTGVDTIPDQGGVLVGVLDGSGHAHGPGPVVVEVG